MTRQSRNVNREASLELSLTATKSLLSDYSLRARQAEQTASMLMRGALTDEQLKEFAALVGQQMDVRNTERSVQQQALLQMTVVALNAALQAEGEDRTALLTNIVRDLTSAISHLQPQAPKQPSPGK